MAARGSLPVQAPGLCLTPLMISAGMNSTQSVVEALAEPEAWVTMAQLDSSSSNRENDQPIGLP